MQLPEMFKTRVIMVVVTFGTLVDKKWEPIIVSVLIAC